MRVLGQHGLDRARFLPLHVFHGSGRVERGAGGLACPWSFGYVNVDTARDCQGSGDAFSLRHGSLLTVCGGKRRFFPVLHVLKRFVFLSLFRVLVTRFVLASWLSVRLLEFLVSVCSRFIGQCLSCESRRPCPAVVSVDRPLDSCGITSITLRLWLSHVSSV